MSNPKPAKALIQKVNKQCRCVDRDANLFFDSEWEEVTNDGSYNSPVVIVASPEGEAAMALIDSRAQASLISGSTFAMWSQHWTNEEKERRRSTEHQMLIAATGHEIHSQGRYRVTFLLGSKKVDHKVTIMDDQHDHNLHDVDLLLGCDFYQKCRLTMTPTHVILPGEQIPLIKKIAGTGNIKIKHGRVDNDWGRILRATYERIKEIPTGQPEPPILVPEEGEEAITPATVEVI